MDTENCICSKEVEIDDINSITMIGSIFNISRQARVGGTYMTIQ